MSQSRQQSSSILFQQSQPNQSKLSPLISPQSATKLYSHKNIKKQQTVQIKPNIIKVKSTPRIKHKIRNKILFDQQAYNQSSLNVIKIDQPQVSSYVQKLQQQQQHQYIQGNQDQCKSQTLSNQQTKPKTLDQQEIDNAVQQINMLEYPVSYYTRNKDKQRQKQKEKQKIKSQQKQQKFQIIVLPPRNAKRQLDGSGDDDQIQQKLQQEKQEEGEVQDFDQELYQSNFVSSASYNNSNSNKKMKKIDKQKQKSPSIQIHFGFDKLSKFIHSYFKKGYQFQCIISCQSGFFGIGTKYHLKQRFQPKILLSAKKQLMSLNPRFLLSLNKQNHSRRHQDFVGIMQSNFSGTSWTLKCPILSKRQGQTAQDFQTILCGQYNSSVMGSKSIRDVNVYLLQPQLPKTQRMKINLQSRLQTKTKKNIIQLKTAKPSLIKGKYQLDFKGLAKMASNKNFILLDQYDNYCLVFAKQTQQSYIMNIRYPLTLCQGFSLCLASLDNKLFVN